MLDDPLVSTSLKAIQNAVRKDNLGQVMDLNEISDTTSDTTNDLKHQQEELTIQIEKLQETEAELTFREKQLRKINNYVPGVIYQYQTNLTSNEGSLTYVSPRSIDLFEYPAEALVANEHLIWGMVHPDDIVKLIASVTHSARKSIAWCGEFRILTPSGKLKWVRGHSEPDGDLVGFALHNGIFLDVTDLKMAEAEMQNLGDRQILIHQISNQIRNSFDLEDIITHTLSAIRQFLKTDNCSFAWCGTDGEQMVWQVVYSSSHESLPCLTGIYPQEQVGPISRLLSQNQLLKFDRPEQCQDPTHRKFLETIQCQSELLIPILTRTQRVGILINTYHFSQHDWTHCEIEFLQAVAAQLSIAISQAELYQKSLDQSQQLQQTLLELQKSQAQIIQNEKMSSLGHLVAGIAHEINNPVNFIHGNLVHTRNYTQDLLTLVSLYQETYPTANSAIAQHIEEIDLGFIQNDFPKILGSMEMGTGRIREIVTSLRNFSRLDEASIKSVDIHQGIDSTLLILQHRMKGTEDRRPISIEKNYGELPLIECMAGQLNQVFLNILVNAIDALDEQRLHQTLQQQEQRPSCIKINTVRTNDREILIVIQNNGPSIPKAIQSKIFDPFFTTKSVGKGTGMGMSISYQIITKKHNGQISVQSDAHRTVFSLTLPIQNPSNRSDLQQRL